MQTGAEVTAAGQCAGLEAGHELVSRPHLDARAVVVRNRVEGAVEATSAQRDGGLELVPGSADVRELVADADELHRDLVPVDLRELARSGARKAGAFAAGRRR